MLKRVCLLLFALSLSTHAAAAKPSPVPMPLAQDLPVELIESQQEMAITVPQTATAVGMQFGLIGAVIGSAVQNAQVKKAEAAVVPLRDLLVDYRFNQNVHTALQAKLRSEGLSPNPDIRVLPTEWEAVDAQQSAELPPYALVLRPSYAMDSDFSQMTVTLLAQVVDRTVKPNGKIKVVQRFARPYAFKFPLQGVRSQEPVRDWVALGGAGLARLLDQGIAQTTDMLVQDFSADGRASWETKAKDQSATVNGNVYRGVPVRQGEGWAWVRQGKGRAQTLEGFQPLTVGAALEVQAAPATVPGPAIAALAGAEAQPLVEPGAASAGEPVAAPAADVDPAAPAAEEAPADPQPAG